jgi:hypothetical protein
MKPLVVLGAVLAVAGCSASTTGGEGHSTPVTTASSSETQTAPPPSFTAPLEAKQAACDIFAKFIADEHQYTPHDQVRLIADLDGMYRAAVASEDPNLIADVPNLLEHVGSSTWPEQGTAADKEVTDVQADCS